MATNSLTKIFFKSMHFEHFFGFGQNFWKMAARNGRLGARAAVYRGAAALHPCTKITCEIMAVTPLRRRLRPLWAAAATAAAVAVVGAGRRQRLRLGGCTEKEIKIFTKTWKTKKLQKRSKKSMNFYKNVAFGEARQKRTSSSNTTWKTTLHRLISMSVR